MVGKRLIGNLVWSVYSGRLFEVGLLIYTDKTAVQPFFRNLQVCHDHFGPNFFQWFVSVLDIGIVFTNS
jgi:hypothetical protein